MIYNDQKDADWFRPTLSQYGRTKRRATATNKQQRFLSSATAAPPRPQSSDKPPKGVHPSAVHVQHMPDHAFHHMFAYSLPPPAVLVLPLPNCALVLTKHTEASLEESVCGCRTLSVESYLQCCHIAWCCSTPACSCLCAKDAAVAHTLRGSIPYACPLCFMPHATQNTTHKNQLLLCTSTCSHSCLCLMK